MLVLRPVWSYFNIFGSVLVDAGELRGYGGIMAATSQNKEKFEDYDVFVEKFKSETCCERNDEQRTAGG